MYMKGIERSVFWRFLVISELGSRIYIVKSAILIFLVFLSIVCMKSQAIDIDNIWCLEPFYHSESTFEIGSLVNSIVPQI